ncbi:TetR/AcrR family transcriptional regulator [Rhodococcus sp. D2-41]|uniref:TetR/AcrR family transcriptional regulator n=1 Tax=Speluncibacter jeojiensis TaxID=2710754 RepID=A0A9X4LYT2_9ACTN|nr:TetR/AcrR family transcriptional regulator [Rhodococcus sp. D2-41]MDG3010360.1 TetR/AcrR family transcriptional regulator [Rhodococcus sp. D2-41]MDG3014096.1 TetR/AcrR family transcriptional regulator [Corynebacteriales bacterium D3-21]
MPESQPSDDQPVDGRRLRYAGRREQLLRAVTDYVLEHGTTAVAMRPLAKAVGVSHAALLHHFGSKNELLSTVVENLRRESMPAELAHFATAGAGEIDPTEVMRAWWAARTAPDELPRFRLTLEVFAQALLEPDEHRRFLTHFVDDWLTAFERIVLRAGCPPDQASLYATLVLAQIRGLLLHLLATGDRAHVDRAFDLFVDENRARMRRWREGQLPELPSRVPTAPALAVPALPETDPEPPALPKPGAGV